MTCIVGIVEKKRVHMGADSCISDSDVTCTMKSPKLYRSGAALIGFAGTVGHCQIVQRWLASRRLAAAMLRDLSVAESLRRWVKKRVPSDYDGTHLIGIDGSLFILDAEFGITEVASAYAAVGNGDRFALGALFATDGSGAGAPARIVIALSAAEAHAHGVRRPWSIAST